jgi:hypothetical protein
MEWQRSSFVTWFMFLLLLNILDILFTIPIYEINPLTIYIWGKIGVFLSAWIKIGMVLSFGVLYAFAKKFAKPTEWPLAKKLFLGILIALLVFYIFVVAWNTILFAHFL